MTFTLPVSVQKGKARTRIKHDSGPEVLPRPVSLFTHQKRDLICSFLFTAVSATNQEIEKIDGTEEKYSETEPVSAKVTEEVTVTGSVYMEWVFFMAYSIALNISS